MRLSFYSGVAVAMIAAEATSTKIQDMVQEEDIVDREWNLSQSASKSNASTSVETYNEADSDVLSGSYNNNEISLETVDSDDKNLAQNTVESQIGTEVEANTEVSAEALAGAEAEAGVEVGA